MRRLIFAAVLAVPVTAALHAQAPEVTPPVLKTASNHPMRYWLSLPDGWTSARRWPVVVVIESAARNFEERTREFERARGKRPFILVVPLTLSSGGDAQENKRKYGYPEGAWSYADRVGNCGFDDQGLRLVIEDVQRLYAGEPRVFLYGWQEGGDVVWHEVFAHPERLRAAAMSTPYFLSRCVDEAHISTDSARATLPVRVYYGGADLMWTPGRPMVEQWERARAIGARHGYHHFDQVDVPGGDHAPFARRALAWFSSMVGK